MCAHRHLASMHVQQLPKELAPRSRVSSSCHACARLQGSIYRRSSFTGAPLSFLLPCPFVPLDAGSTQQTPTSKSQVHRQTSKPLTGRQGGSCCCSWLPGLGEEESRKRQEKALQLLKDRVMTPLSGGLGCRCDIKGLGNQWQEKALQLLKDRVMMPLLCGLWFGQASLARIIGCVGPCYACSRAAC